MIDIVQSMLYDQCKIKLEININDIYTYENSKFLEIKKHNSK